MSEHDAHEGRDLNRDEHTGLKDAQGRTALELLPELEPHWIETYGRVALTGTPVRFEQVSAVMGRWFDVYASPVAAGGSRRFGVLFTDITAPKRNDEVFRRTRARLESRSKQGWRGLSIGTSTPTASSLTRT